MNNLNTLLMDNYTDFVIAIESVGDPDAKIEILSEGKLPNGDLKFLRFRACLQAFINRNRNRRKWHVKYTRPMFEAKEVRELLREGGVPCENGHPVPDTGEVTIERILTIDPNRISHVVKEFIWPTDTKVDGIIETIYDMNGPGCKFMWNIMQGLPVSFSTRSIIPQRKSIDGSTEQTGPGRYVCSDRVFLPSHPEAYIDKTIPVKEVCKKSKFESVMESYTNFVAAASEKVNRIVDDMDPTMESASMGESGMISIPTREGIVGIYPELKYRREFADLMQNL